jgi:hypothetical protein
MRSTMTINDIREAMFAAGHSYWTQANMRSFNSRIESPVYNGPGGIFYVTSEGDSEHRYINIRKFDPLTNEIETVGEFNAQQNIAKAKLLARKLAAGSGPDKFCIVASGTLTKRTDIDDFHWLLNAKCGLVHGCSLEVARRLVAKSGLLQHYAEEECNGPEQQVGQPFTSQQWDAWHKSLKKRQMMASLAARKLAGIIGCRAKIGGDPRGCIFKLVVPNGFTDDFGGEGVCVPDGREEPHYAGRTLGKN